MQVQRFIRPTTLIKSIERPIFNNLVVDHRTPQHPPILKMKNGVVVDVIAAPYSPAWMREKKGFDYFIIPKR